MTRGARGGGQGAEGGENLALERLYAIVIRMTRPSQTNSILSVRVTPAERALLEEAAADQRTTLSDFVRRKAVEAAEAEVLARSVVTIPAEDWQAFEAWAARPAEPNPQLARLLRRKPAWEG
jgi:uncharacterized protein (DUF1778 family)